MFFGTIHLCLVIQHKVNFCIQQQTLNRHISDGQTVWTAVPTTFQIFIMGSSWDKTLPDWTEALRFDWLRLSAQGQVFENSMLSELGRVSRANLLCEVKPLGTHYSLQIGVACHAFSLFIFLSCLLNNSHQHQVSPGCLWVTM